MSKFLEFRSGCSCKKKRFLLIIPDIGYPACYYERITTSPYIRQTFAGYVFEADPKAKRLDDLLNDLYIFLKRFNKKKPVIITHGLSHILVQILSVQSEIKIENIILIDPVFNAMSFETNKQRFISLENEIGQYFNFRFRRAFNRFDFASLMKLSKDISIQTKNIHVQIPTLVVFPSNKRHLLNNIKLSYDNVIIEEMNSDNHSLHIINPQILVNIFSNFVNNK